MLSWMGPMNLIDLLDLAGRMVAELADVGTSCRMND